MAPVQQIQKTGSDGDVDSRSYSLNGGENALKLIEWTVGKAHW
jgi:hypothetical protein